jgi:hypothetical protein
MSESTQLPKSTRKGRRYRSRVSRDDVVARVTISLLQKEKDAFEKVAFSQGVTLSRIITDAASNNLGFIRTRLFPESPVTSEDLEFMISIVKAVGVPLALEELLSLLQKHKTKEVSNV